MNRRDWLAASSSLAQVRPAPASANASTGKTLCFVVPFAESGFDPPRVGDASSIRVIAHIFEPLLTYDPLAQPVVLVPLTAAARPEVSADFRRFVFTLQRGILFADDPVFKGQPRELVAADYVYSFKRFYDPAVRTEHLYIFENAKILGLSELRARALKDKTPLAYDTEVAGLRVLDRYRFEVVLAAPAPRFAHLLSGWMTGAVAREVVQAYADDLMAHPVGTGPFRLAQWRRASRTVLERNPRFREERFTTLGAPDDNPALQAVAQRLAGARAPLLDRIEIDVIEEAQPRWLAFLNGSLDMLTLPPTFGPLAMPGGKLAPFLAKRGVQAERVLDSTSSMTFFNFADPVVGGLTPDKVALRRAVALAFDSAEHIRLVVGGQAVPANSLIPPHCYGHDPALRSELSAPSPSRARALLERAQPRRRLLPGPGLRPECRPEQRRALCPAGLRSPVRAATRAARRPATPGPDAPGQQADAGLHALHGAQPPHRHRLAAARRARPAAPAVQERLVSLGGCGRGSGGAIRVIND